MKNLDILGAGTATASSAADNATATCTLPASVGQRYCVTGVVAAFSAAVASVKAVTLSWTEGGSAKSLALFAEFSGALVPLYLPGTITGDAGTAVTATLAASGAAGTTGTIAILHSKIG